MSEADLERLLRRALIEASSAVRPPPSSGHVVDDPETLACWSLGTLSSEEHAAILEHLAACAPCRSGVAELIQSGTLTAPPAPPLRIRRGPRRWIGIGAAALAVAAVVLVVLVPWLGGDDLALAERDLRAGRAEAALHRLERTRPSSDRRRQLIEEASYVLARADLEVGRLAEVRARVQAAEDQGAGSARLRNLSLQAAGGATTEVALARNTSLLDLGYTLDGIAPHKGDDTLDSSPALDDLERQWRQAAADYPQDAMVRVNCGAFLLSRGKHRQAREQFAAALQLDKQLVAARVGLGISLFERADEPAEFEPALQHFLAVLGVQEDNVAAHLNAALCLEQMHKRDEARGHWQRAAELTTDATLREKITDRLRTP